MYGSGMYGAGAPYSAMGGMGGPYSAGIGGYGNAGYGAGSYYNPQPGGGMYAGGGAGTTSMGGSMGHMGPGNVGAASNRLRESQVQAAEAFLRNPGVQAGTTPFRRIDFLQNKGVTTAEIAEALRRVKPNSPETSLVTAAAMQGKSAAAAVATLPNTSNQMQQQQQYNATGTTTYQTAPLTATTSPNTNAAGATPPATAARAAATPAGITDAAAATTAQGPTAAAAAAENAATLPPAGVLIPDGANTAAAAENMEQLYQTQPTQPNLPYPGLYPATSQQLLMRAPVGPALAQQSTFLTKYVYPFGAIVSAVAGAVYIARRIWPLLVDPYGGDQPDGAGGLAAAASDTASATSAAGSIAVASPERSFASDGTTGGRAAATQGLYQQDDLEERRRSSGTTEKRKKKKKRQLGTGAAANHTTSAAASAFDRFGLSQLTGNADSGGARRSFERGDFDDSESETGDMDIRDQGDSFFGSPASYIRQQEVSAAAMASPRAVAKTVRTLRSEIRTIGENLRAQGQDLRHALNIVQASVDSLQKARDDDRDRHHADTIAKLRDEMKAIKDIILSPQVSPIKGPHQGCGAVSSGAVAAAAVTSAAAPAGPNAGDVSGGGAVATVLHDEVQNGPSSVTASPVTPSPALTPGGAPGAMAIAAAQQQQQKQQLEQQRIYVSKMDEALKEMQAGAAAVGQETNGHGSGATLEASVGALLLYIRNIRTKPDKPNFRKLLKNDRYKKCIKQMPGAESFLSAAGFQDADVAMVLQPDAAKPHQPDSRALQPDADKMLHIAEAKLSEFQGVCAAERLSS